MSGNTKNSKNMNKTKTIAWRTWTITWTKTWTQTITRTKTRTRTWTRTRKNNGNTNKNKKQDHEQEQNQQDTEHLCEVAGVSHSASGARSVEVTILCEGETLRHRAGSVSFVGQSNPASHRTFWGTWLTAPRNSVECNAMEMGIHDDLCAYSWMCTIARMQTAFVPLVDIDTVYMHWALVRYNGMRHAHKDNGLAWTCMC